MYRSQIVVYESTNVFGTKVIKSVGVHECTHEDKPRILSFKGVREIFRLVQEDGEEFCKFLIRCKEEVKKFNLDPNMKELREDYWGPPII